jgi:hypothetical protein
MSAIAALRGYRTQFLYSLYYILSQDQPGRQYRLEGVEDLDVLDSNGNIVRAIQVKNLQGPVVLSDIASSKENKTSFLRRLLLVRQSHPEAQGVLVSFGPIGDELKKWSSLSAKKKEQYKIDSKSWGEVKDHLSFSEVNESQVADDIENLLWKKYPNVDPLPTADLLLYWISVVAEKQQIISLQDLFNRIEAIAKYLSERIAIEQQYGVYISPLHLDDTSKDMSADILKDEFYKGVSARYSHIQFNLDVLRPKILDAIRASFALPNNIVVLHGASGQGKSTAAYRYAHNYFPGALIYELNIQENPEQSRLAILSLQQMTRSLQSPVLLLIHVKPNSTAWLRIVREFAGHAQIKFLITVRQEDWYKALSFGVEFLHGEIEMTLSKEEAELVYQKLNEHNPDLKHTDFEEAWIKFGERGPMLEFVYSITQGKSLENAISQQVSILQGESTPTNSELLTVLRAVSLADLHSARVQADLLKRFGSINATLKRLEKEYLIKVVEDKRYVVGLHPERSRVLVSKLFDDFLDEKRDFSLSVIGFIETKDIYEYLLSLITSGTINASDLMTFSKKAHLDNWATYYGVFKSLIWCGVRTFLLENRMKMNEAYGIFGDMWTMFIDTFLGNTFNVDEFLGSQSFISEEFKLASQRINGELTSKDSIFQYAKEFLSVVPTPRTAPVSAEDWYGYGELLFWTTQLTDKKVEHATLSDDGLKTAFVSNAPAVLAKLMFGLTMSGNATVKSSLLQDLFIQKFRIERGVLKLEITEAEVKADFLIDVSKRLDGKQPFHDQTIEIVNIMRQAFPNKELYKSQGHGHKLPLFPLPYDDTTRQIPAKALPFEEWVDTNAILRQLFEYSNRPADWNEFCDELQAWESSIASMIKEINQSFAQFYNGSSTATIFASVVEYAAYRSLKSIKPPKSISDPFGIYYDKGKPEPLPGLKLKSKYQKFFDAYSSLRSSLTAFFQQFANTLYSVIKNAGDPTHVIDNQTRRLSFINLFEAIKTVRIYNEQRQAHFNKYLSKSTGINESDLIAVAFTWKQFASGRFERTIKLIEKSATALKTLLADFEKKLTSNCKARSKGGDYQLQYLNDPQTKFPLVVVRVDAPMQIIEGLKTAFDCIKEAIGQQDAETLRHFMLSYRFENIYILPLIKGNSLNDRWYSFPLHAFENNEFEGLGSHHFVGSIIDGQVQKALKLKDWTTVAPKILEARSLLENFTTMQLIVQHLKDLGEILSSNLDEVGQELGSKHYANKMNESSIALQFVLDFFTKLISQYPEGVDINTLPEQERDFWLLLHEIHKNILPVPRPEDDVDENYEATITPAIVADWSDRLEICSALMGHLYFVLCGKYIASILREEN